MMLPMYGGNYIMAVRKTVFAETVSMNFVMAGMIPTMVVLASIWEGSDDPLEPSFWFRMSLASIVGGALAYPINYWLVKNHLKHGCMTLPNADGAAPALGHASPEMDGKRHPMEMKTLPQAQAAVWVIASFAVLTLALYVTNLWVPIRFGGQV